MILSNGLNPHDPIVAGRDQSHSHLEESWKKIGQISFQMIIIIARYPQRSGINTWPFWVSFLKDYPSSSSQSNSLPSFSKINIPYLPTFQKTFFDTDMSSSNSLTQSNSSPRHQETKSKDFKDSNQFMSNSYFHPVYFCHNDLDEPSRISRIANDDITEKLSEMKLQRPSHSSRKPTKQKKVNVSPYYRKSLLSPPRTPEVFRKPRNRMQIMSTVKVEVKEPQKTGNLKDTQHSWAYPGYPA